MKCNNGVVNASWLRLLLLSVMCTTSCTSFIITSSLPSAIRQQQYYKEECQKKGTQFKSYHALTMYQKRNVHYWVRRQAKSIDDDDEDYDDDDVEWGDADVSAPSYEDMVDQMEAMLYLCENTSSAKEKKEYCQKCQEVFDEMVDWYYGEDVEELEPTTHVYNLLIQTYCAANDVKMAKSILQKMEESSSTETDEEDEDAIMLPKPNLESYLPFLAYSPKVTPQSILSQITSMYNQNKQSLSHLEPTITLCNALLKTYTKRSIPADIDTALQFLQVIQDDDDGGGEMLLQTNRNTYNLIMSFIARSATSSNKKSTIQPQEALVHVKKLFTELQSSSSSDASNMKPNSKSYNALIKAYANTHSLQGAKAATDILVKLVGNYKKQLVLLQDDTDTATTTGESLLRPNPASFVNAIYGWRYTGMSDALCAEQAQDILELMEELANYEDTHKPDDVVKGEGDKSNNDDDEEEEEEESLWPDVRVYNAVLHVISRSSHPQKVQRSHALLAKMRNACFVVATTSDETIGEKPQTNNNVVCPNTRSYNNVLSACAFLSSGRTKRRRKGKRGSNKFDDTNDDDIIEVTPNEKMEAFKIAVETLNHIRRDGQGDNDNSSNDDDNAAADDDDDDSTKQDKIQPNHVTYGLFLKCCGTLLPQGNAKRDAVIENVFRKCCREGLMSDFVLESFRRAASDDLCIKILGGDVEDMDVLRLPVEWGANV